MNKLISIIIPTLNRAELIDQTLDSVVAQEYKNWECIIIDDGSTDGTEIKVNKFTAVDRRFRYYKRPSTCRRGASSSRNFGFQLSKGEYIQYLDSDDLLAPAKLSSQLEMLRNSNSLMAGCGWTLFKEDAVDAEAVELPLVQSEYGPVEFLEVLGKGNSFLPPHNYLTPRQIVIAAGPWDESLSNNDDAEFFTRVLFRSSGILFNPAPLAHYRRSSGNNLSNYSNRLKVLSAIRSWNLIESRFAEKIPDLESQYVKNSKRRLFDAVKNKYPLTVGRNRFSFREQLENEKYRLNKKYILKKTLRNTLRHLYRKVWRA